MNFGSKGNYLECKGTRESKESLNFRGVIFLGKIFLRGIPLARLKTGSFIL